MGGRLGRKPGYVALAVAAFMLASMLGIAFERDLVGPLSQHGWGHSLQGRRGRADPAGLGTTLAQSWTSTDYEP